MSLEFEAHGQTELDLIRGEGEEAHLGWTNAIRQREPKIFTHAFFARATARSRRTQRFLSNQGAKVQDLSFQEHPAPSRGERNCSDKKYTELASSSPFPYKNRLNPPIFAKIRPLAALGYEPAYRALACSSTPTLPIDVRFFLAFRHVLRPCIYKDRALRLAIAIAAEPGV